MNKTSGVDFGVDLFALYGISVNIEEEQLEDYLKKEEKILSLLRDQKHHTRKFHASGVMEAIGTGTARFAKVLQEGELGIIPYLLRMLGKLVSEKLLEGEDSFKKLFLSFSDVVKISSSLDPSERFLLNEVKKASCRLPDRKVQIVSSEEIGVAVILPVSDRHGRDVDETLLLVDPNGNIRETHNGTGSKVYGSADKFRYCCNPDVFSILVLIAYMRERVQRDIAEFGMESVLFQKLQKLQEERLEENRKNNDGVLYLHEDSCRPYILKYLRRKNQSFLRKSYNKADPDLVLQEMDFLPAFLMETDLNTDDFAFSIVMGLFFDGKKVKDKQFLSLCGVNWKPKDTAVIVDVLKELVDDYQMEKEAAEYEDRLTKDYASVWETKKNIPKKVLKVMAETSFNDVFGYVEIDEMCDLDKIRELEKEWKAIVKILGLGDYKDTALRFRKLGNHKAAGLYFPFLRCLCVDVRYPSSMVHEVFHIFLMKFGDTIGKEVVKAEMEVGHFYELEESDENIRRRSSCDVYEKVVKILNSIEGGFEGIVLEPGTLILTYRNGDRIKMFTSEYMSITNLIDNISECREFEDCQTADRWFTME